MTYFKLFLALVISVNFSCAQAPTDRPLLQDKKFDARVSRLIDFSIPIISVDELNQNYSDYIIFDTREKEEFAVSHLKGAQYLGYEDFDVSKLSDLPKNSKIVLYCSVGYRSEKIGEKLKKLGYQNVFNLYGSIFEWINRGHPVVDFYGNETQKVHTYNKSWSKWVNDDTEFDKIW